MDNQKLLYTIKESGERLNLGRSTLFDLIRSGRLKSVKVGARRLIRPEDLAEFVRRLAVGEVTA